MDSARLPLPIFFQCQGASKVHLPRKLDHIRLRHVKARRNPSVLEARQILFNCRRDGGKAHLTVDPLILKNRGGQYWYNDGHIGAEFMRITTKPLISSLMAELDKHTPKLLALMRAKGGVQGKKIKEVMKVLDEDSEEDEIITGEVKRTTRIFIIRREGVTNEMPADVGITLEGTEVINNLDSLAVAVALLFGLIYALNMNYPKNLRYFFEVIQKVFMRLDEEHLTPKVQALKNKLFL
ncbi:hypothetical protein HOLleu_24371 [Holothuria leucospilota]|uniref:Uncharacterized protein n=1 Tax=Holothuria leucospilota TaxID=206669 RepID=A0A9Q1H5V6_HOLLE|nr:hypothetical protein HOLleu_24371 [Holothuria leucospilota]